MTGRRTVAYIGDSTFFHSGLPALANAVKADDNITVVILDNYITAMTGFQPSLTTSPPPPLGQGQLHPPAPARFSAEETVRGLGVTDVHTVDPFKGAEALEVFKKARNGTGVNVVICRAPCAVYRRRLDRGKKRTPFVIDQERCNACSLCIRVLGCPGILVADGQYVIDQDLCEGCALCAQVCEHQAIGPAVSTRV
jgi:indolepyruvate ferredoxin oxidoreductase alpha subunit